MTPVATEDWSARSLTPGESASRKFIISGCQNERAALESVSRSFGVIAGVTHPADGNLFAAKPAANAASNGPGLFEVSVRYEPFKGNTKSDPTLEPPSYQWLFENANEPIDRDIDGNLIVNSASDLFKPAANRLTVRAKVVMYRSEREFPVQRNMDYANCINSDPFMFRGFVIEPGQAFFNPITQVQPQKFDAKFVKVQYHISLHPGFSKDNNGVWDGFQLRLVDQGMSAFWADGKKSIKDLINMKGKTTADEVRISQPALLDGRGGVLDKENFIKLDDSKVRRGRGTNPELGKLPFRVWSPPNGIGKVLIFKNYPSKPFSPLNLFY